LGPPEILVQRGGGAQTTHFLSSAVPTPLLNLMKYFPKGRLRKQQGDIGFEGRLIVFDHPEIVSTSGQHFLG
jgi:hypothetical protein